MEFLKANDENEESSLLQTIRIPKNLLFLTDKLPQANYEKIPNKRNLSFNNVNNYELPDINKNLKIKKSLKKSDRKDIKEKKNFSENKENKDKNILPNNPHHEHNHIDSKSSNNNEEDLVKKYEQEQDENNSSPLRKRKKPEILNGSWDHSQISGNNLKIIKNSDNNSSMHRDKSPYIEENKRKNNKENNLPNIKNQISQENQKYDDIRGGKNKYYIYFLKKIIYFK